jgi:hypothetical protein
MRRNRTMLLAPAAVALAAAAFIWRVGVRNNPPPPSIAPPTSASDSSPPSTTLGERVAESIRRQRDALATASRNWDSVATPAFTLYMPRNSYAATRSSRYVAEVDSAIDNALRMLGERSYPAHLRVYYVGSRDEMKAIMGNASAGSADAEVNRVVFAAADTMRPLHRHEIMHAVSLLVWGHPGGPDKDPRIPTTGDLFVKGGWLREGLAAAAEDVCGKYTYGGVAAQMQAEGQLLPLDTLIREFYRKDDLITYLQAGSLVKYLLSAYGPVPFRELWRGGGDDFAAAYGKTLSAIEAEWQQWLRAVPDSARPPSVAGVRKQGCT